MLIVGLTGGIGSGKTTVANNFKRFGIPVIDADIITRDLVTPSTPVYDRIIKRFGLKIIDEEGQLNRQALRQIIFDNAADRKALEDILHPEVRKEIIANLKTIDSPYVLVVVPLLIETGMQSMFDRILVVDCDESDQIKRVIERDHCSEKEVRTIMQTQASRKARLAVATDILKNTGSFNIIEQDVKRLHYQFLSLVNHHT